jgi:hypothetical protein
MIHRPTTCVSSSAGVGCDTRGSTAEASPVVAVSEATGVVAATAKRASSSRSRGAGRNGYVGTGLTRSMNSTVSGDSADVLRGPVWSASPQSNAFVWSH